MLGTLTSHKNLWELPAKRAAIMRIAAASGSLGSLGISPFCLKPSGSIAEWKVEQYPPRWPLSPKCHNLITQHLLLQPMATVFRCKWTARGVHTTSSCTENRCHAGAAAPLNGNSQKTRADFWRSLTAEQAQNVAVHCTSSFSPRAEKLKEKQVVLSHKKSPRSWTKTAQLY